MAVIKEYWQGVQGDQDRRQIKYLVTDAVDDNAALNQMEVDSPFFYDFMPRENIRIKELSKKDKLYQAVALYTRRNATKPAEDTGAVPKNVSGTDEPAEEDPDKGLYSFDVSVQSELEYFPNNVKVFGDGTSGTDPDGRLIQSAVGQKQTGGAYEEMPVDGYNFDPTFGYRGRDILRPAGSFTLDHFPDDVDVTRTYQDMVETMVGKVNSVRFRKKAPGEVMLVAARGESRNNTDWQFSFTFQVKKNRTNVDLGNGVVFASVDGWDIIDPWYVPQTATENGFTVTVHKCRQARVWRPYLRDDLGKLFN